MYWALRQWLADADRDRRLQVSFFDNGDLDSLKQALRPDCTRLVWLETPANPLWTVDDIAAAAALAHAQGAKLCVDSTVATPVLTRPLELGADIVMHAATKALNGHSDVDAGALATASDDDALWAAIRRVRQANGAVLGAFDAWLLLRGMRTLYLRVAHSCRSAQRIAEYFQSHAGVSQVLYPGLAEHPQHALAARQMHGGFGSMLSLRVAGGEQAAITAASRVRLWKRATSLGGVESLIEHRASIEGAASPVPTDLLRLSVGIESAADLIADLDQALALRPPATKR